MRQTVCWRPRAHAAWLALLLLVVWMGGATLSGCKRDEAPPDDTLRLALKSPRSLDPNIVTESEGGEIVFNTFEGLFVNGPSGQEILPGVAETWEVSDDGLTWTFHLRENAKWSDGEPVTAHDFVYSFRRILAPETAAEYASFLAPLKNALKYTAGTATAEDVGAVALDDHTLQLTLEAPSTLLPQLLSFYATMPVPRHVIEKHGADWTKPEHWVSNGPYTLVENTDRVQLVIEKNPHYWGKDDVAIERVVYQILPDLETSWRAYEAGQVDMLDDQIPPAQLYNLWISGSEKLHIFPRLGVYMVVFNNAKPPFDDPRVRQAFNMAIDKGAITKYVTNGGESPARTLVDPLLGRISDYESVEGPAFDPAGARKLLAEAGYPGGKGLGEVVYRYNTDENHKKIAETLQQMWKQYLGVDVELANNEWKIYLDNLKAGDFQMGRYGWIGDYIDPMTFLDLWESSNPNNYIGFEDAEYDRHIAAARAEPDPLARYEHLHKAEERFVELLPVAPLYYYKQKMVIDSRVRGVEPQALGVHLVKYMRLDGDKD